MKLFYFLLMLSGLTEAATYNCRITRQTDFSATTVSTKIVNELGNRKCLVFQNQSGGSTVYIKFDSAHSGTENFSLAAGQKWEPIYIPMNKIYVKSSAGVVTLTVLEGQ